MKKTQVERGERSRRKVRGEKNGGMGGEMEVGRGRKI